MMRKRSGNRKKLNQMQFIASGFLAMIIIGTLLLMLPISSSNGEWTSPLSALFTATSASCVTGLVVVDTFTHWSLFGQIIILALIQIGGLGFITIGVGFAVAFQKHIGLRQRDLLKESVNAIDLGGIIRLWKNIVKGTAVFEGAGAILLAIRFIPRFGIGRGIYFGIFHSVSAFCNAGFDLMGINEEYSSLVSYVSDPYVNIVICALIILGGLGFLVWRDVWEKRFRWREFTLHTKIVLSVTAFLIISGSVLFYILECNASMKGMDQGTKILASVFGAVTPRTAGFNTVDNAALSSGGKLLSIALMFIGGSPGSTAGGIKTTTIAVLVVYVISMVRNSSGVNMFKRRVSDEVVKKASLVFLINLFLVIVATMIIVATTSFNIEDTLVETVSAVSTVGMSVGITRGLGIAGQIACIVLMYIGRTGSMTFALSVMNNQEKPAVKYPEEKIAIG